MRRRQGDGVIFKLPSVFLETILGLEALTTNLIARNISINCNSFGSAIWASAKNIKPLVDANCHTEAIESAYHQSPILFSPIRYRNPGSKSRSPSGQTILFGLPLELRIVGELKKIPLVLEYLLDSVHHWSSKYIGPRAVGQEHRKCTTNSPYRRWRNTGLWRMSLSKHGQVWRTAIALSFQCLSCKTTTGSSLWFVRSNTPYGKLKKAL